MVDFHELSTAKFDVLDNAATAWTTVVEKLKSMVLDWRGTVVAKVDAAGWSGPAADQARPSLKRTDNQLLDAITEATAIASIFKDAATSFQAARTKLDKAVADAKVAGLTVTSDGTVSWPPPDAATRHDDEALQDYKKEWGDKAEAARKAIDAAVAEATAADERIAFALNSDSGTDQQKSFNGRALGGGPEADGERAVALAAKGGTIGDSELKELNTLLASYSEDPRFATTFYQGLGPGGLVRSWYSMVGDPAHLDVTDERWAQYRELQKNLGLNLATATRRSNQPHLSDEWAADLRRAGAQPVGQDVTESGARSAVYFGYQVLAPILETGTYDPHFLDPIAEHVTQLDATMKGKWPAPMPRPDVLQRGLNLLGGPEDGVGYQPTTGIMTALAHSPAASLRFFTDAPTAYDSNGNANPGGPVSPADYLTYYAHGKSWHSDTLLAGDWEKPTQAGPAAFGRALEAATTQPVDAQPVGAGPAGHTDEQARLMHRVVDTFGTHGGDGALDAIKDNNTLTAMRPSLARMTGDYMGDVQNALVGVADDFPVRGVSADLNTPHMVGLLDALGRDPESYGIVANAGQAFTNTYVAGQIADGGPVEGLKSHVGHTAHAGGMVIGILGEARNDEVHNQHAASDQAYNDAVERNGGYAKTVVDKTLSVVPGGAKIQGLADLITDHVINSNKVDTTEDGRQQVREDNADARGQVVNGVRQAVEDGGIGRTDKLSQDELKALRESAIDGAGNGYTEGAVNLVSVYLKGSKQ
ncbi:hypothetical protein [Kitasatospora brasiliensis]|uniref:hypothetical protein n=1 Tax=Kitasatospora brasiliensis TaxID=3058040 RepID=UPI00292DBA2D|nr:hypothetical protein [Kitasatospora sp. K002]